MNYGAFTLTPSVLLPLFTRRFIKQTAISPAAFIQIVFIFSITINIFYNKYYYTNYLAE